LAGQVLLKIALLLMRWLFSLAVLVVHGDRAKSAELLVLRHENAVLRPNAGRIRNDPGDRAWFAALTRFIPRRDGRRPSRSRPRRCRPATARSPPGNTTPASGASPAARRTVRSIARLTIRLAQENPLWCAARKPDRGVGVAVSLHGSRGDGWLAGCC
jgi:hypothetical protein